MFVASSKLTYFSLLRISIAASVKSVNKIWRPISGIVFLLLGSVGWCNNVVFSDFQGFGLGSLTQIIPSEGVVYERNCDLQVSELIMDQADKVSMGGLSLNCGGHQIWESPLRFKKVDGQLYYIDEDGFISTSSDGTYSERGDLHFSFRRSQIRNIHEVHIKECNRVAIDRECALNSYTDYEIEKKPNGSISIKRDMTYETLELRQVQDSKCPGVVGQVFDRHTYSHRFRGLVEKY